jgi:hypothetical protein
MMAATKLRPEAASPDDHPSQVESVVAGFGPLSSDTMSGDSWDRL